MTRSNVIVTAILFYVGWFGSVFLAVKPYSSLSLIFPAFLLGFLASRGQLDKRSLSLGAAITVAGILFDALLIHFDLIEAKGKSLGAMPIWLISIWLLFSFSIVKLAPVLKISNGLAAVLGLVFGPLSYKSGEYFQVLSFETAFTWIVYALFWALVFPIVMDLSRRLT